MSMMDVDIAGPDFYCPYCRRWLVRFDEDGDFDLADRASVGAHVTVEEGGLEEAFAVQALAVDARCLRWSCRFRRWLERS